MKKFDDGNIEIQYSDENEPGVLELMNQVLIAYETITSLFKLKNYNRKIIIYLYNSVEELHNEVFGEKQEEWKVAIEDAMSDWEVVKEKPSKQTQYKIDSMKFQIVRHCKNTECSNSECELYRKCIDKVQVDDGYSPKVNLLDDWNLKEIVEAYHILKEAGEI